LRVSDGDLLHGVVTEVLEPRRVLPAVVAATLDEVAAGAWAEAVIEASAWVVAVVLDAVAAVAPVWVAAAA
jgi:hypothetical protein